MKLVKPGELPDSVRDTYDSFWAGMLTKLTDSGYGRLKDMRGADEGDRSPVNRLYKQTMLAVQTQMEPHRLMLASEPSRYMYMLGLLFLKESAVQKRMIMADPIADFPPKEYDMEGDIRDTTVEGERELQSKYQNEIAYWKAMDEERYGDAKILLASMQLLRAKAEPILKMELLNWRLNHAAISGDRALFMEVLAETVDAELYGNREALRTLLGLLLSSDAKRMVVVANEAGSRAARAAGKSQEEFIYDHVQIFWQSLMEQVIEGLSANPRMGTAGLKALLNNSAADSRRSFLGVSPYVIEMVIPQL